MRPTATPLARAPQRAWRTDPLDASEPTFESVFGVPPDHRLLLVRSRTRGGAISGTYWHHEEYDTRGELVARYESYREFDTCGSRTRTGWKRFDCHGRLIGGSEVKQ
jgi:hypothetical protein